MTQKEQQIFIKADCRINRSELIFSFSRSSGPGGQNVNKVNSKVTLAFDVNNSVSLNQEQKQLVMDRLANKVNRQGMLRVTASESRSQMKNREIATERLANLLRTALHINPSRRPTRTPNKVKEKRLQAKKNRGQIKKLRNKRFDLD